MPVDRAVELYKASAGKNLRSFGRLYQEKLHLVVPFQSDIQTLTDLKNKRLGVGDAAEGYEKLFAGLLKSKRIRPVQVKMVRVYSGKAADMMVAGLLDAMFVFGLPPLPLMAAQGQTHRFRLVPLGGRGTKNFVENHPFFHQSRIETNVYGNARPIYTFGVDMELVGTTQMDKTLVREICKSLWAPPNLAFYKRTISQQDAFSVELAFKSRALPYHDGVLKWLKEQDFFRCREYENGCRD